MFSMFSKGRYGGRFQISTLVSQKMWRDVPISKLWSEVLMFETMMNAHHDTGHDTPKCSRCKASVLNSAEIVSALETCEANADKARENQFTGSLDVRFWLNFRSDLHSRRLIARIVYHSQLDCSTHISGSYAVSPPVLGTFKDTARSSY